MEMLPPTPQNHGMIFAWDYSTVDKIILQDAEISKITTERLDHLLQDFNVIMSTNTSDIKYIKFIKMEIENDPNLPPVSSKPYTISLKHHEWVRKELKDLKKSGIIQCSLSPDVSLIVIVPRKCPPGSQVQETKRLFMEYQKLKVQPAAVLGNKISGVVT